MTNTLTTPTADMDGDTITATVQDSRGPVAIGKTITQNIGYTPEQFAELVARLLDTLQKTPKAHPLLHNTRAMLEHTRRQLRPLIEYKEMHDLLQQMALSYQVVYYTIYDEEEQLLPVELVHWRIVGGSCFPLLADVRKLCAYAAITSFAIDIADWRLDLLQTHNELENTQSRRDLANFAAALRDVSYVLNTQTSRMNDRLIGCIDTLGLTTLVTLITRVHRELSAGADREQQSEADVRELTTVADRLIALRNEHDRWQQIDNELRREWPGVEVDLHRFQGRWARSLGRKLYTLSDNTVAWAQELLALLRRLDATLTQGERPLVLAAFEECRRAVTRRFMEVDFELRALCGVLKEVGSPLDQLLEQL
jgi:ribosomal protein S15P/S13E